MKNSNQFEGVFQADARRPKYPLSEVAPSPRWQPMLSAIATEVKLGLSLPTLVGQTARICLGKHLAFYLARRLTKHTLSEIGTYIGYGAHHTSVLHGIMRIQNRLGKDPQLCAVVAEISARLRGSHVPTDLDRPVIVIDRRSRQIVEFSPALIDTLADAVVKKLSQLQAQTHALRGPTPSDPEYESSSL